MNQGIRMGNTYLSRDSHSATDGRTATHATVRHLTSRVEFL